MKSGKGKMNIDSGNALSTVAVDEKEKTGKNVDVDLEKADGGISATSTTDGGGEPLEPVFSRAKELPFSRARLVGLVVTLTGAAFLNVSNFFPNIYANG